MSSRTCDHPRSGAVDLEVERAALAEAKAAVQQKLAKLAGISGGGADELADEYIDAVVAGTIEKLQQELVVFGRIDDDHPWRIGLYGIDAHGDQLVVDWRAPFAAGFYQARFEEPRGLERRTTYVGAIDDLFVEEFSTGEVTGTSPLMGELSRSRGGEMRAAVATLQSEQDELVRLDSSAKLVLRGGPGTGKTVVGLHRAAWLVYNDTSLTSGRILVIGPSDRFLRFVSAVLPTLGEARIAQTTFDHLLGPSTEAGSDPRWLELFDRFEESMLRPAEVKLGSRFVPAEDVAELMTRARARSIPWRDQRKVLVNVLANRYGLANGEVGRAVKDVWPACTAAQAQKKLRSRKVLLGLGADPAFVDAWLADPHDGAWADEVRARFEGVPASYGHVIVDEAQDMSLMQLRAVQRRATGLSLVGDDAQRSSPHGLGLQEIGRRLEVEPSEMATAYRMSAEIADWLNGHASRHGIDAVRLVGIRPTGRVVRELAATDRSDGVGRTGRGDRVVGSEGTQSAEAVGRRQVAEQAEAELRDRWSNVAIIRAGDTWSHKGVEYDGVVVDRAGMSPREVYLAASRAAHELVLVG